MASKHKKYTEEQIKQFKAFSEKVTKKRFAKKCEYIEGESPDILSPEETQKDPESKEV